MSYYPAGKKPPDGSLPDTVMPVLDSPEESLDSILDRRASIVSKGLGVSYEDMSPSQWIFLTHYWCPECKMLPLYNLDLRYLNKVRCGKCRTVISFPGRGKYGKIRKKLAFLLWQESKNEKGVSS